MAIEHDDMLMKSTAADGPWCDVAGRARDWFLGYERGREEAHLEAVPDESTAFALGINAGLKLAEDDAQRERRFHAQWECGIDEVLDKAQRLLREGQVLAAHRAISSARRNLDAPQDARIARMGLR